MAFHKGTQPAKEKGEIAFEVIEDLGTIATKGKYALKLQYGKWNGGDAKYDLRQWNTETGKCGKGLTLGGTELEALYEILKGIAED